MRKEDVLSFREFYLEGVWLWRISGGYSQAKIVTQKNEIVIYIFN